MSDMTVTVGAYCANCEKIQPLNKNARCSVCNSDAVTYPKPRDARTAFARHLYSLVEKIG